MALNKFKRKSFSYQIHNNYIQENIGDFNQFTFNYGINMILQMTFFILPMVRSINFHFEISPDQISDDSYL